MEFIWRVEIRVMNVERGIYIIEMMYIIINALYALYCCICQNIANMFYIRHTQSHFQENDHFVTIYYNIRLIDC